MAAKFQKTETIQKDPAELYQAALQSVLESGFGVTMTNESAGLIQAKTDFSASSFGEKIDIKISGSQVWIKSECAMPTQVISWGKNKKNVNKIFLKMSEKLR